MADSAQPPVFDPGPFEELTEVGGPELIQELTELFLADTPALITELEMAAGEEDWAAMGRAAHTLKASAFYLGALALSDVARRIEAHTEAGQHADGLALVGEPRQAFEAAGCALRTACADLPPA